jgi:hypothetical protein
VYVNVPPTVTDGAEGETVTRRSTISAEDAVACAVLFAVALSRSWADTVA